ILKSRSPAGDQRHAELPRWSSALLSVFARHHVAAAGPGHAPGAFLLAQRLQDVLALLASRTRAVIRIHGALAHANACSVPLLVPRRPGEIAPLSASLPPTRGFQELVHALSILSRRDS